MSQNSSDDDQPKINTAKVTVKSPLQKMVHQLKALDSVLNTESQVIPKDMVRGLLQSVQKFAEELEHERKRAELSLIDDVISLDGIKFQRGIIYVIRKLQRDWVKE